MDKKSYDVVLDNVMGKVNEIMTVLQQFTPTHGISQVCIKLKEACHWLASDFADRQQDDHALPNTSQNETIQ